MKAFRSPASLEQREAIMAARVMVPAHALVVYQGDNAVILDLANDRYYALNPVATRIWRLLSQGTPFAEIVAALVEAYGVPREKTQDDVVEFLAHLRSVGLARM